MNWRLTHAASPGGGPNFPAETNAQVLAGAQAGGRARRPSILDSEIPPTEFLAAQQQAHGGSTAGGVDLAVAAGAPPGARARARTNSSVAPPPAGAGGAANVGGVGGNAIVVNGGGDAQQDTEVQNERALEVLNRVEQKLNGRDFKNNEELDIVTQVNKLIMEATKLENLCQHYIGWCSFW